MSLFTEVSSAVKEDFNDLNPAEYLLGQVDCKEGYPAKQYGSDSYIRGFADQYQYEQVLDYKTDIAIGELK
ncbi:MAG TPA: hypothetical protein EYQ26_12400 [Rhodospirillales bacterium]|nr:hypothetical protein [Rhodospirillales bacterium]HIL76750.1 hypothetical protein [Rhodospirillales bacterium]